MRVKPITIREISLLTAREYEEMRCLIPHISKKGWLRTEGSTIYCATCVDSEGKVNRAGEDILNSDIGVRPILLFAFDTILKDLPNSLNIFGFNWTVIKSEYDYMAICDDIVGKHCFDSYSYYFGISEIKTWLEDWAEFLALGLDDIIYDPDVPF